MGFAFNEYLDIIFQTFDIEYFTEFDLYQFIFRLDENAFDGRGNCLGRSGLRRGG